MKKTLQNHRSDVAVRRTALLLPLLFLTACQGTLHTRWAETVDSPAAWGPRMDTLPIEVHGSVPGSSPAQTLARVPNGTNDAAYAQRPGGAQSLATTRRIVLYIGGDTLPTNGTYCTASPVLRIASIASGKVMVATALCDGSRLVTTARREVAPKEVTANTMAHTLNRVKSFLLYGLSSSRAQPALKYTCTNDRADDC